MIFMLINLDAICRKKYLNELLLNKWKELKIFTLFNQFFSFTNDFDRLGVRVMKFTASGHRSLLIEVRGKCMH